MPFAIDTFVGPKLGGWHRGDERYKTYELAAQAAREHTLAERRLSWTPMLRRAVRAG